MNPKEAKRLNDLEFNHASFSPRQPRSDLPPEVLELVLAAREMVEAHSPSYSNKWQCEDGWGVSRRKSYTEDARVLERLKAAAEKFT